MIIVPADEQSIRQAADVIRSGGLIAYPTETYYGLGVDPYNQHALRKLFKIKKRAAHLPILVLIAGIKQAEKLAALPLPKSFTQLAEQFWPGPITLVCAAHPELPSELTGGTATIGMRQSSHHVARKLVKAFGGPVTATSANLSGGAPANSAAQVAAYFADDIDIILDSGETTGTKGSTLVKCEHGSIECIRQGMIDFQTIKEKNLTL